MSESYEETAAKIYAEQSIRIDSSLEEKVKFLIREYDKLETELINFDEKLDSRLTEVNKALNELDKKAAHLIKK